MFSPRKYRSWMQALTLFAMILAAGSPVGADARDACESGEPGRDYGDGSSGDHTVPEGGYFEVPLNGNYRNFTVSAHAVVNTKGRVLRVCGQLTNRGTITDLDSGGAGGAGGAAGEGSDPNLTSPEGCGRGPVFCRDGGPATAGGAGLVQGAGSGGNGGGGGGGGGSARRNVLVDANGGDGGQGGDGGRGGGVVRVYAYALDNRGIIHADGIDASDGGDAPDALESCGAQYSEGSSPAYDLAGGGGGGGGGGCGGDGGTVEIFFEQLLYFGEVHADRGSKGTGGDGGLGGTQQPGHDHVLQEGSIGEEGGGCDGVGPYVRGGDGGWGERHKGQRSGDGQAGADGTDGSPGAVRLLGPAPVSWTDVEHYDLTLDIDPAERFIDGSMIMQILNLIDGTRYVRLRLDRSAFEGATIAWSPVGEPDGEAPEWEVVNWAWRDDDVTVAVDLGHYIPANQRFYLRVQYSGEPRTLTEEMTGGPWPVGMLFQWHGLARVVVTDSEPWYTYLWVPTKDDRAEPGCDKAAADLRITVPPGWTAVSQGDLHDVHASGDRTLFHWKTSHGTPNYLFSIAATNYVPVPPDEPCPVTDLTFYMYPEDDDHPNLVTWMRACDMLQVFSRPTRLGPYPFADEKYAIYQWNDENGSMEHQTAAGQEIHFTLRRSFKPTEITTAHEMSHQWIGDYLTCSTWHDTWIKEGFASYAPALWFESQAAREDIPWRMRGDFSAVLKHYMDKCVGPDVDGLVEDWSLRKMFERPVFVDELTFGSVFDWAVQYKRAPWVYHMLRHVVDPVYADSASPNLFSIMRRLSAQSEPEGCQDTEAFRRIAEDVCREQGVLEGLTACIGYEGPNPLDDLIWFWGDHAGRPGWVYSPGGPEYRVSWSPVQGDPTRIHYTVAQIQGRQHYQDPVAFTMPIDLLLCGAGSKTRARIWNNDSLDTYEVQAPHRVDWVEFDPDHWILNRSRGYALGSRLMVLGACQEAEGPGGAIAEGDRVASGLTSLGPQHATLWTPEPWKGLPGGETDLSTDVVPSSRAWGINERCEIVGDIPPRPGDESSAFLWLPEASYGLGAGANRLGTYPAGTEACARDINDLGEVVGWVDERAVLWRYDAGGGGWSEVQLPDGGADRSRAWAINEAGQVAGMVVSATDTTAVVWSFSDSVATYVASYLGQGAAYCISDYAVAGGYSGGSASLWRYEAAGQGWTPLSLGACRSASAVYGINRYGDAVGVCGGLAVRWRDGIAEPLNEVLSGYSSCVDLQAAWDINDAGRILVSGTIKDLPCLFLYAEEGEIDANGDGVLDNCDTASGVTEPGALCRFALARPRHGIGREPGDIVLTIPRACTVKLAVYDVSGREVMTLLRGPVQPGTHRVPWRHADGRDGDLSSGVYFVRMTAPGFQASERIVILR